MQGLIDLAISQGLGYALFVALFIYVLKTTGERERKYQETIDKLADKFGILEHVKKDVEEMKHKIDY